MRFVLFAALLLQAHGAPAWAESKDTDTGADKPATTITIGKIRIRIEPGPWKFVRTKKSIVLRELTFKSGDKVTLADIDESLTRLKNIQIFSDAEAVLLDGKGKSRDITFLLREKWTTLPIFQFAMGGGAGYIIAGLYDINHFGRLLEAGGQYEYYSGQHGGYFWFRDPRFLNQRLRLGVDLSLTARARVLYDPTRRDDEKPGVLGAFGYRRWRAHLFADQELHRYVTLGLGTEFLRDEFSPSILPAEDRAIATAMGYANPRDTNALLGRIYGRFGRIDSDWEMWTGAVLDASLAGAHTALGSTESYAEGSLVGLGFLSLPLHINLAGRLEAGATSARSPSKHYYVGGLAAVRGFHYGEFSGPRYGIVSGEFRMPSLRKEWLVLQHVAFVDVAGAAATFGQIVSPTGGFGVSVGPGLRILLPRVYRLAVRADYAFTLHPYYGNSWSISAQQFF